MTPMHMAVNALAQVTAWLALVWLASRMLRWAGSPVQWRVLVLRLGLAGAPVALAVGLVVHALPWATAFWRLPGEPGPSIAMNRDWGPPPEPAPPVPASPDTHSSAPPLPALVELERLNHPGIIVTVGPAPAGGLSPFSGCLEKGDCPPRSASAAAPERPIPAADRQEAVTEPPAPAAAGSLNWHKVLPIALRAVIWSALLAWLGGVVVCGSRLVGGLARLRRQRRGWQPVRNEKVRALAARVAGRVGLRRPFRLLAADDLPMPVAMGPLRPAVVVPREQFAYLATAEGRAILAHELAHLCHRDPLWRMIGAALGAVLWFHPLMSWLNRRCEIEAEFQCDEAALSAGADARRYARLLVGLAELAWGDRPSPVAAIGAVHRTSHLERRLKMILSKTARRAAAVGRGSRWVALTVACAVALSLSSVALLGQEGAEDLGLERALFAEDGPRPDRPDAPPPAEVRPVERVVVTLVSGRRVEGAWGGASPEGLRVLRPDGPIMIPLSQIVEIRMLRPPGPPPREGGRGEGPPPPRREGPPPPRGEGELRREGPPDRGPERELRLEGELGRGPGPQREARTPEFKAALEAEKALAAARERPEGDPERPAAIQRAERQVARIRAALAIVTAGRDRPEGPPAPRLEGERPDRPRRGEGDRPGRGNGERLQRGEGRPDGPPRPFRPEMNDERQAQVRKLAGEAEEALKAGRLAAAAEKLDQAIEIAPLPDLLRMRARIAREMGQLDKAEQLEKRAREMRERRIGPGGPPGRDVPRMGRPEQAARRGELREPARKADGLVRAGKWEAASDVLAEMIKMEPRNVLILRAQLRALERLGRHKQAEQVRKTLRELFERRGEGDRDRPEGARDRREGDRPEPRARRDAPRDRDLAPEAATDDRE